jgi:hypothetical protein
MSPTKVSRKNRKTRRQPLPVYVARRRVLVDDPDAPIYGAEDIALVLNLFNDAGEPDLRAAFHYAAAGLLDASKLGRAWVSTPRRLLGNLVTPQAATTEAA